MLAGVGFLQAAALQGVVAAQVYIVRGLHI